LNRLNESEWKRVYLLRSTPKHPVTEQRRRQKQVFDHRHKKTKNGSEWQQYKTKNDCWAAGTKQMQFDHHVSTLELVECSAAAELLQRRNDVACDLMKQQQES
jgi:hypothetical protein